MLGTEFPVQRILRKDDMIIRILCMIDFVQDSLIDTEKLFEFRGLKNYKTEGFSDSRKHTNAINENVYIKIKLNLF